MSRALHWIEERIVRSLEGKPAADAPAISGMSGLGEDQVRRGVEWLVHKGILEVARKPRRELALGPAGLDAARRGLPERRLLDLLARNAAAPEVRNELGRDYGAALGICVRGGWVRVEGGVPVLASYPDVVPGEDELRAGTVSEGGALAGRPGFARRRTVPAAYVVSASYDAKESASGGMDVEAPAAAASMSRTHPLRDVISRVREAFVALGFEEIHGNMVQSGFWNFDALFTPQDHPAREMQDTFYLDRSPGPDATPEQIRAVSSAHRAGWGSDWSPEPAGRAVLRTHTTCVTVRHLAGAGNADARVFSVGRVFRNEKPSYKHLAEFHQVEGVVAGDGVSMRDLMGIQREFYAMVGIKRVRFWPTFFPYTEPSLQSMVYNENLGKWVELFGMGMFRPEVTAPLGITGPVLAWGGGVERLAMLMYGTGDVREFYRNDMKWLRGQPRCR